MENPSFAYPTPVMSVSLSVSPLLTGMTDMTWFSENSGIAAIEAVGRGAGQ